MDAARVERELAKLKDFQRRTVDYVFQRLYLDDPPARRFLVADEVGLGKTMVARGLIAKAIHHLDLVGIERIDIVYVCSNAAIAQQNLNRLNVLERDHLAFATRLTLLPSRLPTLKKNRINFVSFTPGTTFDLKSRGGIMEERALLFHMLSGHFGLNRTALRNLLQATASADRWDREVDQPRQPIAEELSVSFRQSLGGSDVLTSLGAACERFARRKDSPAPADSDLRYRVIGQLRQLLARTCVDALEPDLIFLDEFQRFKDLLHGESEAADLAKALFDYKDARVVLLSATPYRMYTQAHETEDEHQKDFLETIRFLTGDADPEGSAALERDIAEFRRALFSTGREREEQAVRARTAVESRLRRVMSRTERVGSTAGRDSMLVERASNAAVTVQDVSHAGALDRLSRALGTGDIIEYWKSSPYLLSFMEDYELKRELVDTADHNDAVLDALREAAPHLLTKAQLDRYQALDPGNSRMRAMVRDTLDGGAWRLLWLPPSLPYIKPTGPYADVADSCATKSLVFASWNVVPKAIAVMLSYDAERRMLGDSTDRSYNRLSRERKPLLTFRMTADGRPAGMPALALLYPCVTFAEHIDPLDLALDLGDGEPTDLPVLHSAIAARLAPLVKDLVAHFGGHADGAADQRWYWAAPALLDARHHTDVVEWIASKTGFRSALEDDDEESEPISRREAGETRSGFSRHVDELLRVIRKEERLGGVPDDLMDVLADLALASPAVCASRAIRRVSQLSNTWDPELLHAATRVARGFRTLFNVPETIELLRGGDDDQAYWRRVLEYCVDGNVQAMLDEFAHVLVSSAGVMSASGERVADAISRQMESALSPRTASLTVDELKVRGRVVDAAPFRVRCRYALRFGELKDEADATLARAETVRDAFNSPFRPFVLASTSIGQEGLDFHLYCHVVCHWNLPSNPVDLEQREGRVHRFKGHAVRRNIAKQFGLSSLRNRWGGEGDPWERFFLLAAAERPAGANDLIPYWIFEVEGGARVERRVPLLPMSREIAQLGQLKRQLALYRLAFGQPRQEDLLAYLERHGNVDEALIDLWRISLEPPGGEAI